MPGLAAASLSTSRSCPRRWTRSPRRRWPSRCARQGGLGIIHRNLGPAEQAAEVDKVKRSESGMIVDPITLGPDATLAEAEAIMSRYHISGVPITDDGRLVGILTNRDIRFATEPDAPVRAYMTSENLITAPIGTSLEEAKAILHAHRIEKLPLVDDEFHLRGLITYKDILKKQDFPAAATDDRGRLLAAAAVGVGDDLETAAASCCSLPAWTRSRSIPRTATRRACSQPSGVSSAPRPGCPCWPAMW